MKKIIYLLLALLPIQGFGQSCIYGTGTNSAKQFNSCNETVIGASNLNTVIADTVTVTKLTITNLTDGIVKSVSDVLTPAVAGTDYSDLITKTGLALRLNHNSISTAITANQGVAYDGTSTYLTSTSSIEKRNGSFVVTNTNASPFASVTGSANHCGDGEIEGSYLWVPVENYTSCVSVTNIKIVKYLASDLSYSAQSGDLSANITEMSGLTIVGDTIFCSSFCNSTSIKKFNKNTFAFIGSVTLSFPVAPLDGIQGIANDGTYLYLSADNSAIYAVPIAGGVPKLVYSTSYAAEIEGIDYYSSQARWLVVNIDGNSNVIKLDAVATQNDLLLADQRGNITASGSINANASLTVGYRATTSTFPGVSINTGKWSKILFSSPETTNKTTFGQDNTGAAIYCNGYYAGAWQTWDATKVNLLYFQSLTSSRHEWRYAPANSTVTWVTPFYINTNPTIAADLLTETNATYNIGASGNRILSIFANNGTFNTVVNVNGASAANGTLLNTTTSTTNPQWSVINSGTGGRRWYVWSTNSSNGIGAGKLLITPSSSSTSRTFSIDSNGRVGINGVTAAAAYLHIAAGTATANTAPFKYTTGTLNTTAEAGANEYNNSYYQTKNSGLRYAIGGTIFDAFADAGNSTTTETDLHTYTTPASTLAENGGKVTANYAGTFVSSATATRQMKVYFGGTAIFDSGTLTISASAAWDVKVTIIRVSSTVVRYTVAMNTQNAALAAYTAVGELTGLTLTNTNIIKITGQAAGVGAATNDIVLKLATGEWKAVAAN